MHIFHKWDKFIETYDVPRWIVENSYYPRVFVRKCKKCGITQYKVVE